MSPCHTCFTVFWCNLIMGYMYLKKNNRSFRGPSWGGYLCPYVAMTQYFAIYLCPYVLMSPVWISKPVVFWIIDDEETMLLLVFYYCIWDCPHRCRNFNIIFMSFVANFNPSYQGKMKMKKISLPFGKAATLVY